MTRPVQTPAKPPTKRGLARQQKILEVAEQCFLTQGYAGTSVNEIVKLAGGSLGTLYRVFGNKLGLFEQVFKNKTELLFSPFTQESFGTEDLNATLHHFGKTLQRIALSPNGIAYYRLVVTENNVDQSEIQRIFYTLGPQTAIRVLANYLQKQIALGKLHGTLNTELAAAQFLDMIKGPFLYRALFGETIQETELDLALSQGIQLFLHGAQVNNT
ncbi:TetR/AcrR family transcriptional regulator [Thiomicrorhabdus aquaedulcis]|uniref:TetR/AcrR family transcriptional regulator n=1 Tax=Thiomicrorhabdus aquaedulcis TaxID=2211106 RepID=UPI000FDB4A56|nr:TetR/AcrR family transcriptional regulator [Thiomicrorhabdus aquaedulcis]